MILAVIRRFIMGNHPLRPDDAEGDDLASEGSSSRDDFFAPSRAQIESLAKLIALLTSSLIDGNKQRLVLQNVIDLSRSEDDVVHIFREMTSPSFGESTLDLSIAIDWKAHDEIEWQANRMLQTLGVNGRWTRTNNASDKTVPAVFLELDHWLMLRGYGLLFVDTGGDDYLAFAVKSSDSPRALAFAKEAGMVVRTSEEFRIYTDGA